MIYRIVKLLVHITFHFFFRKLHIYIAKPIPKDRPVILAVNHPTAFLDPIIMGSLTHKASNFMLRGDVFTKPFFIYLLKSIHTIPIFRFRDGFSSLKNNQATFDYCYDLLKENQIILILSEGQTAFEKRLRPIQKGTARMAFGAYEKNNLDNLCVIPIGVNYTDAYHLRTDIYVEVGEVIELKDYLEDHQKNPRRAIKLMTDEISKQLKERVIHIQEEEDEPMTEGLFSVFRSNIAQRLFPIIENRRDFLRGELAIAKAVNDMEVDKKSELRSQVKTYTDLLSTAQVSDRAVTESGPNFLVQIFFIMVLALPAFLGHLISWPFVSLARKVARDKVKRKEFRTSIMFGVGMFSFVLFWLLLLIISLLVGNAWFLLFVMAMPFLAYFGQVYKEKRHLWLERGRFNQLDTSDRDELLRQRAALEEWIKKTCQDITS